MSVNLQRHICKPYRYYQRHSQLNYIKNRSVRTSNKYFYPFLFFSSDFISFSNSLKSIFKEFDMIVMGEP